MSFNTSRPAWLSETAMAGLMTTDGSMTKDHSVGYPGGPIARGAGGGADVILIGDGDGNDTIVGGETGTDFDTIAYSGGPSVGITPFKNGYISVGYNVVGFADRDFEESRYTRDGPFITFRLKFDQDTFSSLGL